MKDSTKKRLIIAGLAAVCVLLIFGISRVLYKEPVQELPKESKPTEEIELMVDTEETGQVHKETESTKETKELIIETEKENSVESGKQEIQQTPEKTEDEKPEEPPALTEDADWCCIIILDTSASRIYKKISGMEVVKWHRKKFMTRNLKFRL